MPDRKRKILITGGAGFIGSHVVRLFVNRYPGYQIINLDKLTYAGNLENLRDLENEPNYQFIKGDITDIQLINDYVNSECKFIDAVDKKDSDAINFGLEKEPIANKDYEKRNETTVHTLGFKLHDNSELKYGATPDGYDEKNECLVEYKCLYSRRITKQIPINYWIQMQVQMQVWNIDKCMYVENEFSGSKLVKFWQILIHKDEEFEQHTYKKIGQFWKTINQINTGKRAKSLFMNMLHACDWNNMMTQYSHINYIRDDTVLDIYNKYPPKVKDLKPSYTMQQYHVSELKKYKTHVMDTLFKKANYIDTEDECLKEFNTHQLAEMIQNNIINITYNKYTLDRFLKTFNAMQETEPLIILNGTVIDVKRDFWSPFDVCINNSMLKIHGLIVDDISSQHTIISIKKSQLSLKVRSTMLINTESQKILKSQLVQINTAIAQMTNTKFNPLAYCIGRSKKNNEEIFLSKIDYEYEPNYIFQITEIDEWLKSLQSDEPPKEYKCNLKNALDYPWHEAKKIHAKNTGNLTQLYSVNYKRINDNNLKDVHIDKISCAGEFGFKPTTQTYKIINAFLESKKTKKHVNIHVIKKELVRILNQHKPKVVFYVDFETSYNSTIFMIGTIIKHPNHETPYSSVIKTLDDEQIMFTQWIDMLDKITTSQKDTHIHIYHWGTLEKTLIIKKCELYKIKSKPFIFIDLCKIFRQSFSAICNTNGYGLKDIVSSLYASGEITTTWKTDETRAPIDGVEAMAFIEHANNICRRDNLDSLSNAYNLDDIAYYNYIDCKTMEDIVRFVYTH